MENIKRNKLLFFGILIASLIQVISPVFSSFRNTSTNSINTDPQFTPAGYAFAIWGVITLLALCNCIYQFLPNRKSAQLYQQIAPKLIPLYLLFAFWLFAASNDWLIITVITFVIMFILTFQCFQKIISNNSNFSWKDKILVEGQLGLYVGWCTVAIFANTGAAIKFYGFSDLGTNGIIWQSVLLLLALSNSIYGFYKTNSNYFFGGTILWAFVAIYIGLCQEPNDTFILQQIVIIAIIALFSSFFIIKKFKKQTLLAN